MGAEWIMNEDRDAGVGFDFERDLLCTADANGYFTSLNGGWERLLGWTGEELARVRSWTSSIPQTGTEPWRRRPRSPEWVGVVHFENRCRARGGGWRWLRWSMRSDGEAWFAVAFDITERKETEQRLRGLLTDDHLLPYTQPILDQRRGTVAQEELLVRAGQGEPRGGHRARRVPPDVERCGLIGVVDRWMTKQGMRLAESGRVDYCQGYLLGRPAPIAA